MAIQKITSGIIQDGAIAAADIVSVANTAITGNITSSQIAPDQTLNGNVSVTGTLSTPNTFGFKNRIINGGMVIDQRNAGASLTITANPQYTLDRWFAGVTLGSKISVQQNAGAITPPTGFTKYLGVTSLAATTPGVSDVYYMAQSIEGFNVADFAFGTANASAVTISFRVYSSLTGTFGAVLLNAGSNRSYPFNYTISSANTWTTITQTIPGDTTGTWATDNSTGFQLRFGLGSGATNQGTAGAWGTTNAVTTTTATTIVATNGATFYITGVQLEKGSTATSFDFRDYGRELMMCQRYYEISYNIETAIGSAVEAGMVGPTGVQGATTGSEISTAGFFRVTKRATPTMSYFDTLGNAGKCNRVNQGVGNNQNSTITNNTIGASQFSAYSASGATATAVIFQYTASAEL